MCVICVCFRVCMCMCEDICVEVRGQPWVLVFDLSPCWKQGLGVATYAKVAGLQASGDSPASVSYLAIGLKVTCHHVQSYVGAGDQTLVLMFVQQTFIH